MSDFTWYIESLALRSVPATQAQSPAAADPVFNRRLREALAAPAEAAAVIDFCREAGLTRWFAKDAEFDRAFRDRFLTAYEAARRGELLSGPLPRKRRWRC